jgi:hypothetical protein
VVKEVLEGIAERVGLEFKKGELAALCELVRVLVWGKAIRLPNLESIVFRCVSNYESVVKNFTLKKF